MLCCDITISLVTINFQSCILYSVTLCIYPKLWRWGKACRLCNSLLTTVYYRLTASQLVVKFNVVTRNGTHGRNRSNVVRVNKREMSLCTKALLGVTIKSRKDSVKENKYIVA
jgi:hypothetical protein